MKDKIFEFIKKVNAISHIGITYSKDNYALDSYNKLLSLSVKMLHQYIKSDVPPYDIYKNVHYPTPQLIIKVMIIKDDKILMIKDKSSSNNLWTLPGKLCDTNHSLVEASIKEVKKEIDFDVKITKLLGIIDNSNYQKSKLYNTYTIVFLANIINNYDIEMSKAKFFDINNLPELSDKFSAKETNIIINAYKTNNTYFE